MLKISLEAARVNAGLTQKEVASVLKVSNSSLQIQALHAKKNVFFSLESKIALRVI